MNVVQASSGIRLAIDHPEQLVQKILRQGERWQDFHTDTRIVVFDDKPHTVARYVKDLSPLYGEPNIVGVTDGDQLLELILNPDPGSKPFDLALLDVYTGGNKTGLDLMKLFGPKCPNIVFCTASATFGVLGDMTIQMDTFRSHNAGLLVQRHIEERFQNDIPVLPILTIHKDGSLEELIEKIDAALLIGRQVPIDLDLLGQFVERYSPKRLKLSFSDEMVHDFCEDLRNLLKDISRSLIHLRDEHQLENTEWWKLRSDTFLTTLLELRKVTFTTLKAETPQQTWNNLHAALSQLSHLSPKGLDLELPETAIAGWEDSYRTHRQNIDKIEEAMRAHQQGIVELEPMLKTFAEQTDILYIGPGDFGLEYDLPGIENATGEIRQLFEQALELFRKRIDRYGPSGRIALAVFYESQHTLIEPNLRKQLETIDCGSLYSITIADSESEGSFEDSFKDLCPTLVEFRRKKLGVWSIESKGERFSNELQILVKIAPPTIDLAARKLSLAEQILTPSFTWNNTPVYEKIGNKQNITVIGKLPEELLLEENPARQKALGVLHNFSNTIHLIYGGSHLQSEEILERFYCSQYPSSDPESRFKMSVATIQNQDVRFSYSLGCFFLDIPDYDQSRSWAIEAMVELGLPRDIIICQPGLFASRQ